jgi:putative DNA primase/helicase
MSRKVVPISAAKATTGLRWTDFYHLGQDLYCDLDRTTGKDPDPVWVCGGNLRVVASTRYAAKLDWGLLLTWYDSAVELQSWIKPTGAKIIHHLEKGGLKINQHHPLAKKLLVSYIELAEPSLRITYVGQHGWHGDLYVTRRGTIGPQRENERIELDPSVIDDFELEGTLEEWQETIGKMCVGNSRLVFHVCIALASLVLRKTDGMSVLFHFVSRKDDENAYGYDPTLRSSGKSRTGKSTALHVACSVNGTQFESWQTTQNALEEIAEANNDSFTPLDDIALANAKDLITIGYMLSQGRGKARMGQRKKRWCSIFTSNGEITYDERLAEANLKWRLV